MTGYQLHCQEWRSCEGCDLCKVRKKVVLARGHVPADVLFVGEAPGVSEDVLGKPFVGPAGKLLDHWIDTVLPCTMRHAITNLIGCIPKDADGEVVEPPKDAVHACAARLEQFIALCKPRLIVMVGTHAQKWMPKLFGHKHAQEYVSIIHPAAILRMDISQKGLAAQRAMVTLSDALEEL